MQISRLEIHNFKSIRSLTIEEVDLAMILVGRNNTGKTVVLDAILTVAGMLPVDSTMFNDAQANIEIMVSLKIGDEDLQRLHGNGMVSKLKNYEKWYQEFRQCLPSFADGVLSFTCCINHENKRTYADGVEKNNPYIMQVFPNIHYIDNNRNVEALQEEIFNLQGTDVLEKVRRRRCMFDEQKPCNHCFTCIGAIEKKNPLELSVVETAKLLEYQVHNLNVRDFSEKVNHYFQKNSGRSQEIQYTIQFEAESMLKMDTQIINRDRKTEGSIAYMSEGTKSIYLLSLLEAYINGENRLPCLIMMEDPEIYLHPQLQKVAGEILYRLSKKNQVIFSTHSPNMLFNFTQRQIKQVVLDDDYYTTVREDTDIDEILDDLGYSANDLMNVSFVFIVEGKQDRNRLPLLLEKYYSEIYDEDGMLQRISIIPTNSCTNIKTYANLKYINKLFLKDQFLMIRDSDGKKPEYLVKQLCSYYGQRAKEEGGDSVPRVQPRNVLVLKYYSFENYFLDPAVMAKIGVIRNEQEFYNLLYDKYKAYLYRLSSWRRMVKQNGIRIRSKEDLKQHMEMIKIYVRGHNLFDIFYGKYRGDAEQEILKKYIDAAPRECFDDILRAIDRFVYFENRKKTEE